MYILKQKKHLWQTPFVKWILDRSLEIIIYKNLLIT